MIVHWQLNNSLGSSEQVALSRIGVILLTSPELIRFIVETEWIEKNCLPFLNPLAGIEDKSRILVLSIIKNVLSVSRTLVNYIPTPDI